MAVRIRLRRTGAKNVPLYRIVVADSRSPVKGKFIEKLGWYDPRAKKVEVDKEKVLSWASKGAKISNSVKKILLNFAIVSSKELD
ncbi:30S ribosomal protein S16 [Candidatus Aerophobetes bacterium]|uniref:Small ribosomal subunit protein bS16 n=1 Tax=Aerophobetes bacterium TaxID=2030807 RepID=A0A523TB25_UNCAE|nr:MAG: 30S ribosomal protein S16 [Candidatus Aerophobetes bacterium]